MLIPKNKEIRIIKLVFLKAISSNNSKRLTTRFTGATLTPNLLILYNYLHKLKFRIKAQPCGCVRYNRQLEPQKLNITTKKYAAKNTQNLQNRKQPKYKLLKTFYLRTPNLKYLSCKLAFTYEKRTSLKYYFCVGNCSVFWSLFFFEKIQN